jgi:hypothetical protein
MCQMSAVVEHDGKIEVVKENLTRMDVVAKGVKISTLFEEPIELTGMVIHYIDFLAGKVILHKQ